MFLGVLAPFGALDDVVGSLPRCPSCVLLGLASPAPWHASRSDDKTQDGLRARLPALGIMPMVLFCGAFFPITELPPELEWLARLTPLWHGVDLSRMLLLDQVQARARARASAYLAALAVVGWVLAVRYFDKRLVV